MTLAELRKKSTEPAAPAEKHAEGHHPGPLEYIQIGVILSVVTAVEVALYYLDDLNRTLLVTALLVLSVAKFVLVVLWFMHLKFDNRLFSIFFGGGMALTFAVFAVVIAVHSGKFA